MMTCRKTKIANHIKILSELPEWHQNKMIRLSLRLLNNDAKAHRIISLKDSGAIGFEQFLIAL